MKAKSLIILLLLLAVVSCSRHSRVSETLAHAEAVMEEHPDSALPILQAVPDSALVTDRDRALQALLLSQALDKNYIDITSDSLINIALDYFRDHNDRYEMLSNYYYAKVTSNAEEYTKSTFAILKAKELSEKMKDTLFIARSNEVLADLYFSNFDFENEIKHRKIAIKNYHDINRTLSELYANIDLSLAYTQNGQPSTAIEVLEDIDSLMDTSKTQLYKAYLEAYIYPCILIKEYTLATDISELLIKLYGTEDYSSNTYCELSELYLRANNIQKAKYFLNKSIDKYPNTKSSTNVLLQLLEIYKYTNDIPSILSMIDSVQDAQNNYAKTIVNQQISNSERDYYNQKAFESDKKESLAKRNSVIVSLVATIIIIVTIFLYLYQRTKNRNMKLEIENNLYRLKELEGNLWQKDSLYKESSQALKEMRRTIEDLFHQKFEIINSFSHYFDSDNRHEENAVIVYRNINKLLSQFCDKDSIKKLEKIVDDYQNGMMTRFHVLFPNLPESQYRMVLYIFLGFTPSTISIFLNIPKNNFYVYRSRLKKLLNESKKEIPTDIKKYFT